MVDISVYYPSGSFSGHDTYCTFNAIAAGSAPVSFVPTVPGTWVIDCNGYSSGDPIKINVTGMVFPLPEYSLGALVSVIACFAALGVFVKKKRL